MPTTRNYRTNDPKQLGCKFMPKQEVDIRAEVARLTATGLNAVVMAERIRSKFGVDISVSTVKLYRQEGLKAAAAEMDEENRLALARYLAMLDESMSVIADKVQEGDLAAIDRQVKLIERASKMRGGESPKEYKDVGPPADWVVEGVDVDPVSHGARVSDDLKDGIARKPVESDTDEQTAQTSESA